MVGIGFGRAVCCPGGGESKGVEFAFALIGGASTHQLVEPPQAQRRRQLAFIEDRSGGGKFVELSNTTSKSHLIDQTVASNAALDQLTNRHWTSCGGRQWCGQRLVKSQLAIDF